MLNNVRKSLEVELKKTHDYRLELINKLDNPSCVEIRYTTLGNLLPGSKVRHTFKSIGEIQTYLKKRLALWYFKELASINEEVNALVYSKAPKQEIIINLEWTRSSTWGACPKASAYIGRDGIGDIESERITGCGYCKTSTAVAQVLNQIPALLSKLTRIKNQSKNITRKNCDIFGYGSGCGVLPRIEGGVGVSCYPQILESIGGSFETVSSGKTFDVYRVTV